MFILSSIREGWREFWKGFKEGRKEAIAEVDLKYEIEEKLREEKTAREEVESRSREKSDHRNAVISRFVNEDSDVTNLDMTSIDLRNDITHFIVSDEISRFYTLKIHEFSDMDFSGCNFCLLYTSDAADE